jgi:uncharacterized protein
MVTEIQKQIVLSHLKPIKPSKVGIFGSYARGENKKESDLDILISFDYAHSVSLLKLASLEQNLSEALGITVDLVTEKGLSPLLHPFVQKDLIYIFE